MKRKKKRYRLKKKFKLLLVLFLVVTIFLVINPFKKENKVTLVKETYEYQGNIRNNTDKTIDKDIENLIINFLNTYFRSMKELKEYDMTTYFNNEEEAYLNQTALKVLINSRTKQLNDLKLSNVSYDITYQDITNEDDVIIVKLKEDSYLNFNFMKEITTKIYNVVNTFYIEKVDNIYKIKKFDKEQGYFVMTKDLYSYNNTSVEEIKLELDNILNDYNTIFDDMLKEQNALYNRYLEYKDRTFKTCDNAYDRESARNYAIDHVLESTPSNYSMYGGNCQNYASYVLNAGGIPMDTVGSYKWKHYDSDLDESSKKSGRTSSWTGVVSFYNYAKNNTGYGLCSEVDVNTYYGEKGDIIQIGYDNLYRHTAVVVDTYMKDGNVIDLLLNSNTGDLENLPLSAYVYPLKRLIKVLGFNN